jgi:hypothetical protein
MGFSFFIGETNEVRPALKNGRCSGFVSDYAGGLKTAIHRPAGTREALPGTIAGLAPRLLRLNLKCELRITLRSSAKV